MNAAVKPAVDIAIIGGGIAGLFCALRLKNSGKSICLYEATDKLGGRIRTERYPDGKFTDKTEFVAEFGPMRIEPEQQEVLLELLRDDLRITEPPAGMTSVKTSNERYLVDFPPYSSPGNDLEPSYPAEGEENAQKTALDLLKLAFVRILGKLVVQLHESDSAKILSDKTRLTACLEAGQQALMLAVASRQAGWQDAFSDWVSGLQEGDYHDIRQFAEMSYGRGSSVPLWQLGFWNLLSDVLSHNAILRLRDMGTFYHLISENPNAAEWFTFWLRGLKISEDFKGINHGMESIVDSLKDIVGSNLIEMEHKLVKISRERDDSLRLYFVGKNAVEVTTKRVILALPAMPLRKIADASGDVFHKVRSDIDSVAGLPLLKVFFIVKQRWWEEEHRANVFATRVPTRELHYWKSNDVNSRKGLIMVYTEPPASTFWANYVGQANRENNDWRPSMVQPNKEGVDVSDHHRARLIRKLVQYIRDGGVDSVKESDIEYCGIRDWGQEPYGGAVHTWRPGIKSWEVMKNVNAFAPGEGEKEVLHVCGEAYSDYAGFLEGSLRSAKHVLHLIKKQDSELIGNYDTVTPWLCPDETCYCKRPPATNPA